MPPSAEHDKHGAELAEQRFHMLEDIAKELAGEVIFPTCFDVAVRIRHLLEDPEITLDSIALVLSADPLLSSKLIALSNSALYAGGAQARNIKAAISRLGLLTVRTVSLNNAMRQLLLSAKLANFDDIAHRLWHHSLQTAAACHVMARQMTRINPDTAFLAGMVHDIGAFYMFYRATYYPELMERPESLKYLVTQWHESIGISVLSALGITEEIVEATRDHDCLRKAPELPRSLGDLVYVGNVLAGAHFEWLYKDYENETLKQYSPGPQYLALNEEINAYAEEINVIFS
jgi:HD-like signal output (HDOD) protein